MPRLELENSERIFGYDRTFPKGMLVVDLLVIDYEIFKFIWVLFLPVQNNYALIIC